MESWKASRAIGRVCLAQSVKYVLVAILRCLPANAEAEAPARLSYVRDAELCPTGRKCLCWGYLPKPYDQL